MSRLTPEERLLANLREEVAEESMAYMTRDDAYRGLRDSTGQDFGYDADKWEKWIEENGLPLRNMSPNYIDNAAIEYFLHGYVSQECIHCGKKLIVSVTDKEYKVYCSNEQCPRHPVFMIRKDLISKP
jgi:hypothetical protein